MVLPTRVEVEVDFWDKYGATTSTKKGFLDLASLKCESSAPPKILARRQNTDTEDVVYELKLQQLERKPFMPHPDVSKHMVHVQGLRLTFTPLNSPDTSG